MLTGIDRHFDLNLCSHGVKIEVKQADDNKNHSLYVELSDFCNYG